MRLATADEGRSVTADDQGERHDEMTVDPQLLPGVHRAVLGAQMLTLM